MYTNEAQGLDGLLEAHGNHVIHPSHKETENCSTGSSAEGRQSIWYMRAKGRARMPSPPSRSCPGVTGPEGSRPLLPPGPFRSQLKMKKPSPVDSESLE